MNNFALDARLAVAAALGRRGARFADVGTDHAYLPLYLLDAGVITSAVAADIAEGPLASARANVVEAGREGEITLLLANGLSGMEGLGLTDIAICGMGGELIVRILSDAPWTKDPSVRLILQPMTHPEALRRFLLSEGYSIVDETLVKEEKIYQILCVEYSGIPQRYTALEELFGRHNLRRGGILTDELLSHWASVLSTRIAGKRQAGADTSKEDAILTQIGEWKHDHA